MIKAFLLALLTGSIILFSGCGAQVTSIQKNEIASYKARGHYVEVKSTGTATALGILPGGGSFYTESYGLGVINLLLWPLSILWEPVNGYNGAEMINYHATRQTIFKKKQHETSLLERDLEDNKIDMKQYISKKRIIEDTYQTEI